MPVDLAAIEAIVDGAAICADIEAVMPAGGRPRQLAVRTLLIGIMAALGDDRPAHLSRVHQALVMLPAHDRQRLGVMAPTRHGPHDLTYRQVERTMSTMTHALEHATNGPTLADRLADTLCEASVPTQHKEASTSAAVDWTDLESWSRPAEKDAHTPPADPDAAWGHRTTNQPGAHGELFFGYYAQAVTMVNDETGPPLPELVRRICLHPCSSDPPPAMVDLLTRMHQTGITLGDVIADSGYAHRVPQHWAAPLRALGASLVQDLHPHDRGRKGTFAGAVIANGNLYCPATPVALLDIRPLGWGASTTTIAAHDTLAAELARYKLAPHSAQDANGTHRVSCPAASGKLRCPLKPDSMTLSLEHPEILEPPNQPPRCCAQQTLSVPGDVAAKTRQKHDYPSAAHRRSYTRRTAVERAFSTLKDPASTSIRRGWCRLMGRTKNLIMLTCATVVRNLRVLASYARRHSQDTPAPNPRPRASPAVT